MSNPFEDQNAEYLVLVNSEGQYSLWPRAVAVPDGWRSVFGASERAACLEYVEENWTDMRPLSLIKAMEATAS
jgi:MbtH protein